MHTADQPAPTPRTLDDLYIRLERSQQECKHGNKDSANRCIECTMKETERLERELIAKTAEAERLREALKPKIMPSVGLAIGTRLRDFYRNRFALVNPVLHTDNERQVILAALELLLAALAAKRKEEGARVQIEKEKNADG